MKTFNQTNSFTMVKFIYATLLLTAATSTNLDPIFSQPISTSFSSPKITNALLEESLDTCSHTPSPACSAVSYIHGLKEFEHTIKNPFISNPTNPTLDEVEQLTTPDSEPNQVGSKDDATFSYSDFFADYEVKGKPVSVEGEFSVVWEEEVEGGGGEG